MLYLAVEDEEAHARLCKPALEMDAVFAGDGIK